MIIIARNSSQRRKAFETNDMFYSVFDADIFFLYLQSMQVFKRQCAKKFQDGLFHLNNGDNRWKQALFVNRKNDSFSQNRIPKSTIWECINSAIAFHLRYIVSSWGKTPSIYSFYLLKTTAWAFYIAREGMLKL